MKLTDLKRISIIKIPIRIHFLLELILLFIYFYKIDRLHEIFYGMYYVFGHREFPQKCAIGDN